jgi:hypothetical protein
MRPCVFGRYTVRTKRYLLGLHVTVYLFVKSQKLKPSKDT